MIGLVISAPEQTSAYYLLGAVPVEDEQFQSLLEQVRELHELADQLTRSPRLNEHIRARLNWETPPPVPVNQMKFAEQVVEVLTTPRLTSQQALELHRAFFGR